MVILSISSRKEREPIELNELIEREFGISLTNSLKVINIDIGFSWV